MIEQAEMVQIPLSTYQNILNHLSAHAATDGWARSCLEELERDAVLVRLGVTAKGAYILDGEVRVRYRLD